MLHDNYDYRSELSSVEGLFALEMVIDPVVVVGYQLWASVGQGILNVDHNHNNPLLDVQPGTTPRGELA